MILAITINDPPNMIYQDKDKSQETIQKEKEDKKYLVYTLAPLSTSMAEYYNFCTWQNYTGKHYYDFHV